MSLEAGLLAKTLDLRVKGVDREEEEEVEKLERLERLDSGLQGSILSFEAGI